MAALSLMLEVVTPDRLVVRETVDEAEIPARDGCIGVLPGHTPLLAELANGHMTYRTGNRTRSCTAMGGFVEVLGDRIIVLADCSERAEEIDVPRAQAARDRAQKLLDRCGSDPHVDWRAALAALERAEARLRAVSHQDEHRLLDTGHEAF